MPRHALRSELAAKLGDGWTGPAGRHVVDAEMPAPVGVPGRHALSAEVDAVTGGSSNPTFLTYAQHRAFASTSSPGTLTGVAAGDLLIAFAAANDQSTSLTPPSSPTWTLIGDTGANPVRMRCYVATANGTNPSAGTWTWPGAHWHVVTVLAYRDYATPTTAVTASSSSSSTVTAPSLTATAPNSLLVAGGYYTSNGTSPRWPAGMTVRAPDVNATASGVVADEVRASTGATGSRTFTVSGVPAEMKAIALLLAPA